MDFSALKRNRGSLAEATKLLAASRPGKKAQYAKDDERMWYPLTDKAGNGFATIRFLPTSDVDGEQGLPWVRKFTHGFQNAAGRWFIENCPTTLTGGSCPVCEFNKSLWATDLKVNKELASKQKRKVEYYMNVLVISDPATPANDGTIRIFRFGAKIFEKIQAAIKPIFPDQVPFTPYDFWEGANFKLRITKVEGQRNYGQSEFAAPSPLSRTDAEGKSIPLTDEELKAIHVKQHSLNELISPEQFKTYDEIKANWDRYVGAGNVARQQAPIHDQVKAEATSDVARRTAAPASVLVKELEEPSSSVNVDTGDDNSELDYFKSLVK
jgi:hypothetical protein